MGKVANAYVGDDPHHRRASFLKCASEEHASPSLLDYELTDLDHRLHSFEWKVGDLGLHIHRV
jgi:hypothetical protein